MIDQFMNIKCIVCWRVICSLMYMSRLIHIVRPLKKIYMDSRHCTSDSKTRSDFKNKLAYAYQPAY